MESENAAEVTSRIFEAAKAGNLALVRELLPSAGYTELVALSVFESQFDRRLGLLTVAVAYGHVDVVRELLQHSTIGLNDNHGGGGTALVVACDLGLEDMVTFLLEQKDIDVNLHMPLVRAVQAGNEAIVRLLCESPGIQVNALHSEPRRSRCGNSPTVGSALHVAFARNHVGIQAYLMQRSDVDVNLPDEMGRSALYTAASQGNVAAVERLLAHPKIDVNCKFEGGHNEVLDTPLHEATRNGHMNVVRALCAFPHTQVNALSEGGETALYLALKPRSRRERYCVVDPDDPDPDTTRETHEKAAQTLIANKRQIALVLLSHKDIDVNLAPKGKDTPLGFVCQGDVVDEVVVKLLENKTLDVNVQPGSSPPALWIVLKKLQAADVKTDDADLQTIRNATAKAAWAMLDLLLARRDLDLNVEIGLDDYTPLEFALYHDLRGVAGKLIALDTVNVNSKPDSDTSVLLTACKYGSEETVKWLCQRPDLQLNRTYAHGESALYAALTRACRHVNDYKFIQHAQTKKQAKDDENNTSSDSSGSDDDTATHENDEPTIESVLIVLALLARSDLDVNYTPPVSDTSVPAHDSNNCDGHTPLILACKSGLKSVVHQLCQRPTLQVNARGGEGDTALMHCMNHPDVAKLLLARPDIDINVQNESGHTALMAAATVQGSDALEMLLARPEIQLNQQTTTGKTALHLATTCGYDMSPNVRLLLQHPHIQPDLPDNNGMTALEAAVTVTATRCVHAFIEHGVASHIYSLPYFSLNTIAPELTVESSVTLLLGDLPLRVEGGSVVRRHDHLHTWSQYLDIGTPVDKGVRLEAVQRLIRHPDLRHHPSVARELAMTTDREGRTVLQTTDAATRDLLNGYLFFCGRYEIVDGPPIHISATAVVVHAFDHGLFKQLFDLHATGGRGLDRQAFVACSRVLSPNKNHEAAFDGASKDGPNLTEHEYLRHCSHAYGGSMRVAIKFMRHGADHARELDARTHLDAEFVVGILPMADTSTFADHVRSLVLHGNLNMCEFPNVLVMPAADRSLEDIFLKERPDDTKIRPMMRDVALALAHLHGHGMIHGDLKKLNILRVHQTLQLIDLDAATRVGDDIGSKFSSGILPPEMFVQVTSPTEVDTYETYWKHADRVEWWPKVQPRGHGGWVVRSFRGRAKNVPYQLVKASPAIDMWAFGCMLFQLYSEAELVPTDRNQDADDDAMDRAATWTADALGRRIRSKVSNGLAADLIQRLLVVEPENRMGVRQVLDHAYFHGTDDASVLGIKLDQLQVQVARGFNAIGTKLDTVVDLTKENVNQLATAKRDLMRGIFQATEVTVPTSFVLLPFNLVVHDPHDETAEDVMVKTASFLQRVVDMGDKFMQAAKANKAIGATVRLVAPGDPLYLYLIDEVMGTPVSAGVYPIRIDTKSDEYVRFMTVAMPYIQTGFKCLNWANTAVGWLKVLGVPSLDSDVMTRVATSIESATKSSSVFDFDVLQAAVEAQDAGAPVEQIRGAALRQLERFFQTFDATGDYAGLERTYASNGQVLWTTKDTIAKIELNRRENVAPKTQESTAPLKRQGGLTAQDIYLAMLKNETTGDVEEASSASSVRGRNDENAILSDEELPEAGCACRLM
ncbi:serine/threonine protein kinase [Aphanomyces astaci]|uniref:Serine/threonine protein kinase n=1 Tax=Aphanomyces astaci TaxID=112090 RepID=W4GF65_APHAT|nr:serine/threonine protein kinase [Aphanomyces astaci]ETV77916.1 serine/threonine protein kinase [Aphanomyces astaci]|eukprot:XP_009832253.1 serine/threonine protein kinase [Aphanomyces astaci]